MTQLAQQWSPLECTEVVGTVVEANAGEYVVDLGNGPSNAKRAVGCLIEPRVDDEVVVALIADGRAYIRSVLERRAEGATISVEGDLDIESRAGAVNISGDAGVSLASRTKVSVVAAAVAVSALDGKLMLEKAAYVGQQILTEVSKMRTVSTTVDRTVGRLVDRIGRAYRTVEETDHLRAESIDHRAEKTLKMHAENTLLTSEQLVKVDGSQVHIG